MMQMVFVVPFKYNICNNVLEDSIRWFHDAKFQVKHYLLSYSGPCGLGLSNILPALVSFAFYFEGGLGRNW